MVITYNRLGVRRVWLPIVLVVRFRCPRSRLRIWSCETDSTVPSRVGQLIFNIPGLNLVLTHELLPFVIFPQPYSAIPSNAIGPVPTFSGHTMTSRWRSPTRASRHKANRPNPQGSSSNGAAYPCNLMGQLLRAPLYYYYSEHDAAQIVFKISLSSPITQTNYR